MAHETLLNLLRDPAHWEFEIFLILIFDVFVGLLLWPSIKKFLLHHKSDDERIEELERRVDKLSK